MNIPFINKKTRAADKASPSTKKQAVSAAPTRDSSVQQWYPIEEINNSIYYRKDGYLVAGLRIEPVNTSLMSKDEEITRIELLGEALSGISTAYQFEFLPKPVDMDRYISYLDDLRRNETDDIIRMILEDEIQAATEKQISGDVVDRLFYFLISQPVNKNLKHAEIEIISRIKDCIHLFNGARLETTLCNDDELRTLQYLFFNQKYAATERVPDREFMYSPIYEKGE